MALTKKDLASLRKLLDRAILEDLSLTKLKQLGRAAGLTEEGQEVLQSLTESELAALKAIVQRALDHGATIEDLKFYAPIH